MKLIGKIKDSKETIVGANVYVSDRDGIVLSPIKGVASDIDGRFKLDGLNPFDYISIKFIGYKTITKKISDLGSGVTISRDFIMTPSTAEIDEFQVIEYKDNPPTKSDTQLSARKEKNYKPYIIGGLALLVIIGGYLTYRAVKN